MADLLKAFHDPNAQIGSSAFDLSCKRVFSGKAGQCLPAFVNDTVPGDHFEIDMAALCRTNTLQTPAFVRGKFNYDFFFVPYVQVWHRFNDFVSQKIDLHTSNYKNGPCNYTPTVSLKQLVRLILNLGISGFRTDQNDSRFLFASDALRLLDLLGYGNYYPLLTRLLDAQDAQPDSQEMREFLSDYFHNSTEDPQDPYDIDDAGDYYINLFRLCAYQHIWYDFYRNKYFDLEGYGSGRDDNYQDYFNLDDIRTDTLAYSRLNTPGYDQPTAYDRLKGICTLRFCQWKKDIYTSLMPSQQFGVVSTFDVISTNVINLSTGLPQNDSNVLSQNRGVLKMSNSASNGSLPSNWFSYNAGLSGTADIMSLRRAEAMQKWKEAALRAGNMNDKNQKSHFGVEPFYYEDNNVHFLGSFDGALQLNPVAATADSAQGTNKSVGDLAASATAIANGQKIRFDCRDYGVLMCIARFVPESEYNSSGIEMANTRFEPFDYYNPEFSRLGLQAVPLYLQELNGAYTVGKNYTLGYAPRDYDYKQNVDKVYGEFDTVRPESGVRVSGIYSNWVSPRQEQLVEGTQRTVTGRNKKSFYVDPAVLDNVFGLSADGFQNTDQFVFNCYFDIKAVRKMPVLGLPEF